MADSPAFDLACDVLEADTSLLRLEARGTVRLTLRSAGLTPKSVSADQLSVVVEKLLPEELSRRGVPDGDAVCARLLEALGAIPPQAMDVPEGLFLRMAAA